MISRVRIIDSHTEGEPTRLVIDGGPELRGETLEQKAEDFEANWNGFRTGVVLEPRGSEAWVGAHLLPPTLPDAVAGVIFFNNAGVLGMCGHGTIGLVASLAYLERLEPGEHKIETPVGPVFATLNLNRSVTVRNVLSYRLATDVPVDVPGYGRVIGDIAYGGNWFFLVSKPTIQVDFSHITQLTAYTSAIKAALAAGGITGANGAEIDHIELFAKPDRTDADSKNYVLCPGNAYDRSPCGTGTSAKLACLAASGVLAPGAVWRQESIIGTVFSASYEAAEGGILPSITGQAFVTAESTLVFADGDPFREGIK